MSALHITKVAFGCTGIDVLAERLAARAAGGETSVTTRYKPKRADELIGGSLFWILRHQLVARSEILGFDEIEGGRIAIRVSDRLVPVRASPRRAHQGWRYLVAGDAPADLAAGEADALAALPAEMMRELAALALI